MLSRQNQKGRSMIEMLGVLGIMAVITVLGITAYTMATRNVKSNNIKAEVATIAQQVRTMTQPSEFGEWNGSTRSYDSAFVQTGLMKEYNGMGVSNGYTIIGANNVGFSITVNLDDDEDAALVYSMDWSNADAVVCTGRAPGSISSIPTLDTPCSSGSRAIVIYYAQ
ncbi:MAG: type II secretion system GspH family protein [Alphaproteobacteria bacterium]|nr:type II secretion system GspH family protein [Alphaproteobacteria bacterium]